MFLFLVLAFCFHLHDFRRWLSATQSLESAAKEVKSILENNSHTEMVVVPLTINGSRYACKPRSSDRWHEAAIVVQPVTPDPIQCFPNSNNLRFIYYDSQKGEKKIGSGPRAMVRGRQKIRGMLKAFLLAFGAKHSFFSLGDQVDTNDCSWRNARHCVALLRGTVAPSLQTCDGVYTL